MVYDQVSRFFNGFRRDAHPMAIMVGVVGAFLRSITTTWISKMLTTVKLLQSA